MKEIKDWDQFYLGMCVYISRKSKDRSTKLGAIAVGENHEVLSVGFNGFPRGVSDDNEKYHERPTKYLITEHAERNLIYNAARRGISLEGATLYLPFEPVPCCDCTRGVIQSGFKRIIGTNFKFTGKGKHWDENLAFAKEMLDEVGMEMKMVEVDPEFDIREFYEYK